MISFSLEMLEEKYMISFGPILLIGMLLFNFNASVCLLCFAPAAFSCLIYTYVSH